MFSIKSLVRTVLGWCRSKGGPKASKRAALALECLDHRQLLSANFTGNATIDIPGPTRAGTVILTNNGDPATRHPGIPVDLAPIIKVSGLDVTGIRLAYTPNDDILSIAIDQPDNQKTGQVVLAGDADNNGDGATVDPAVKALRPDASGPNSFNDFGNLTGTETMGVFLDFNNDRVPDVVAGITGDPNANKAYQVADAVVDPDPAVAAVTRPLFGTPLQNNTGASFLSNDPAHPSFEFQITNFSQLYQSKTGHALAVDSVIGAGAFGNSLADDGISEAFFPDQTFSLGVAPPPPATCPPLEPPILINPHEHRHINTAHPTDIRVNILGTARFNVNNIVASTVRLGGATPIASFDRHINRDKYEDRTFVFRGSDIKLPRGIIDATVTGTLTDGTTFESTYQVFNKNYSYYSPQQIAEQQARQAAAGYSATNPPKTPFQQGKVGDLHDLAVEQVGATSSAAAFESTARPTVKIATKAKTANTTPVAVTMPTTTMPSMIAGAAAGTKTGHINPADSPLLVSIPRRPVTQSTSGSAARTSKPVKVVIPDMTATSTTHAKTVSIPRRAARVR